MAPPEALCAARRPPASASRSRSRGRLADDDEPRPPGLESRSLCLFMAPARRAGGRPAGPSQRRRRRPRRQRPRRRHLGQKDSARRWRRREAGAAPKAGHHVIRLRRPRHVTRRGAGRGCAGCVIRPRRSAPRDPQAATAFWRHRVAEAGTARPPECWRDPGLSPPTRATSARRPLPWGPQSRISERPRKGHENRVVLVECTKPPGRPGPSAAPRVDSGLRQPRSAHSPLVQGRP